MKLRSLGLFLVFTFTLLSVSARSSQSSEDSVRRSTRLDGIESLYLSGRFEAALSAVRLYIAFDENQSAGFADSAEQRMQMYLLASLLSARVGKFGDSEDYLLRARTLFGETELSSRSRIQDSISLVSYDVKELEMRHRAQQN